jgi:hypothetical protein
VATAMNKAGAVDRAGGRRVRFGWGLAVLAAVAVTAVAVVGISVMSSTEQIAPVDGPKAIGSIYSADELTVMRLVAKGYIPAETLDTDPYLTKRLINQGFVPKTALESETSSLESLINQGLIPPQTATPSAQGKK